MNIRALISLAFVASSVLQLQAQCHPDRHSTNWFDGWISCEPRENLNPQRGVSHWIMYDFGAGYKFFETEFWNINDPKHLERGVRIFAVDYSADGVSWLVADTFEVSQGTGQSIYEGQPGPDLTDLEARYLLFTILESYGGDCVGFSEVRFHAEPTELVTSAHESSKSACMRIEVYPNPVKDEANLIVQSSCRGLSRFQISDLMGKVLLQGDVASGLSQNQIDTRGLPAGSYVLTVANQTQRVQQKLLKVR